MLRTRLMIGALAIVTVPLLDAAALGQDRAKDKIAPKMCSQGTGSQAALRDGCVLGKGSNGPPQLQIGRSNFGSGGSTNAGGSPGHLPGKHGK